MVFVLFVPRRGLCSFLYTIPFTLYPFSSIIGPKAERNRDGLKRSQPERILYLAIQEQVYLEFFQEEIAQMVVHSHHIKLIIFDSDKKEVIQWIE